MLFYTVEDRNNWYTSKNDKKPNIVVQNKNIKVLLKRNESYEYMGKLVTINGDGPKQVSEIISTYKDQLEKICQCKLSLSF